MLGATPPHALVPPWRSGIVASQRWQASSTSAFVAQRSRGSIMSHSGRWPPLNACTAGPKVRTVAPRRRAQGRCTLTAFSYGLLPFGTR